LEISYNFNKNLSFAAPLLSGALLGLAWIFPQELLGSIFGALSAIALVFSFLCLGFESRKQKYYLIFFGGAISHVIAFSWLFHTISNFGGFGWLPAGLIFILFVTISALQFPLAAWICEKLEKDLSPYGISATVAWATTEFAIFRLFPWEYGHTLSGVLPLIQIADIGGSILVTVLLFWLAECAVRYFYLKQQNPLFFGSLVFLVFAVSYGRFRINQFENWDGINQKIAVIQANISVEQKHNQAMLVANVDQYKKLSQNIPGPDTLIIWPESVINDFIPNDVASVGNDARLPFFSSNNPLLIGALSYNQNRQIFNSTFAILNSGTVLEPYHKQVLMPFGEFMPLSSVFPWLTKLNPMVANFTAGTKEKVFEYPMVRNDGSFYTARVSPLICYEDVIPTPARKSTKLGAQLLVNITNDGWFGISMAPIQHNQIASLRAVENRRYLIRSTNTGLTALVSPTGATVQTLPVFSEGVLSAQVPLIDYMTLYTVFTGNFLGWTLLLITVTIVVARYQQDRNKRNKYA
jgi:apolipoprotein N-acyltransferase